MIILVKKAFRDLYRSKLRSLSIILAIALSVGLGIGMVNATKDAFASFDHASALLAKLGNIAVSRAEIQRVAIEEGTRFDQQQRQKEETYLAPVSPYRQTPAPQKRPEQLVIGADATNVLTVADEENKSVYCATAFALEDRGQKNGRPFVTDRLYTASSEGMEDFANRVKALGWESGMRQASAVAFLGDGARCLWKWAEENMPSGTVFIQDFYHVLEHLANLAKDLFGSTGWEGRYSFWKRRLWNGKVHLILADLRRMQPTLRGKKKERALSEITYLQAGAHRMDYPRYRREGWPIGSGAVEGTCKHLVKERFGVTGAQWRRDNIKCVLALRLAFFNNTWDEMWLQKAA